MTFTTKELQDRLAKVERDIEEHQKIRDKLRVMRHRYKHALRMRLDDEQLKLDINEFDEND